MPRGEWSSNQLPATNRCARNRHGKEKSSKHFQWKLEWKGARLICHEENGVRINCLQQIGVRGNRHGKEKKFETLPMEA
ncbi:hypothetical protein TNCV_3360321 [Trichonephila clavipes]|nr:hypothetical protein TNCV_3360321 [Trichonephila clavipes]